MLELKHKICQQSFTTSQALGIGLYHIRTLPVLRTDNESMSWIIIAPLLFSLFHYLWQGLDWDQLTALQAPAEAWPSGGWWAVTIEYSAENISKT